MLVCGKHLGPNGFSTLILYKAKANGHQPPATEHSLNDWIDSSCWFRSHELCINNHILNLIDDSKQWCIDGSANVTRDINAFCRNAHFAEAKGWTDPNWYPLITTPCPFPFLRMVHRGKNNYARLFKHRMYRGIVCVSVCVIWFICFFFDFFRTAVLPVMWFCGSVFFTFYRVVAVNNWIINASRLVRRKNLFFGPLEPISSSTQNLVCARVNLMRFGLCIDLVQYCEYPLWIFVYT